MEVLSKGYTTLNLAEVLTAVGLGPRTSRALEAIFSALDKGIDLSCQGRPWEGGGEGANSSVKTGLCSLGIM